MLHSEFDHALPTAYFDIRSAFDSVDHEAFWWVLRSIKVPDVLYLLISDLHCGTVACVGVGSSVSDRFWTSSGV